MERMERSGTFSFIIFSYETQRQPYESRRACCPQTNDRAHAMRVCAKTTLCVYRDVLMLVGGLC